jgi:hypothetical protein
MPYAHPDAAKLWTPPKPVQLPDVRRKLIAWHRSPAAVQRHALLMRNQTAKTCIPYTQGPFEAAQIMNAQEAERLGRARLYYVNEAMTEAANRKALRPRPQPLTAVRVPAPYGLVVFASPIGSYISRGFPEPDHVPYVAVSWGRWDMTWAPTTGIEPHPILAALGYREGWKSTYQDGYFVHAPADPPQYWITAYTPAPPDGVMGRPPVMWDTEAWVELGATFEEGAREGKGEVFVRALVAVWDMLTQEQVSSQPIVDVATIERKTVKARQDSRRGIEDGGDVLVVSATARRRTKTPRPRRAPGSGTPYTHRRFTQEHDRDHCMDPRNHRATVEAGGTCYHESITIPDHWRGDESLPVRETVTTLDRPLDGRS